MKKKHQFHCQHCNSPCEIYKKGKGHKVLVCPHCGVIATNPISFKGALGAAASSIPLVGGLVSYGIENVGGKRTPSAQAPITYQKENKLTAFEKALLLERLEHH